MKVKLMKIFGNIFSPILIPLLILSILVCKVLYFLWPWLGLERFYMATKERKWNTYRKYMPKFPHLPRMKFRHMHKELEFSCAWNACRITLDYLGIQVSEEELFAMTGDKKMGTSHWEVKKVLNYIFYKNALPWQAVIKTRVNLESLENALALKHPVILLFLTPFTQEGMTADAHYPHLALFKGIDWENKTIRILSPSGGGVRHQELPGHPGVNEFSIDHFLDIFYFRPKYIMRVEYLPTRSVCRSRNLWWRLWTATKNGANWMYNLALRIAILAAYCLRIARPGTAVIISDY